jgi:hypothetical protein
MLNALKQLLVPQVQAQCAARAGDTTPLNLADCLTLEDGRKVSDVFATPADLVNVIVRVAFIGGGILIFVMLLYSGFLFINGASKGKDQAKEVMTNAIIGMIVMFAAFWILQIIRVITGVDYLGF